ncbi:MAG: hypothetical protein HQ536_01370 [Parcubacteria group bacterium]|nr:hypothetical protein [Parcubacteria group bacterium]
MPLQKLLTLVDNVIFVIALMVRRHKSPKQCVPNTEPDIFDELNKRYRDSAVKTARIEVIKKEGTYLIRIVTHRRECSIKIEEKYWKMVDLYVIYWLTSNHNYLGAEAILELAQAAKVILYNKTLRRFRTALAVGHECTKWRSQRSTKTKWHKQK